MTCPNITNPDDPRYGCDCHLDAPPACPDEDRAYDRERDARMMEETP